MALNKNVYEYISSLDFDPPVPDKTKIEKAITSWENALQDMIARETVESKKALLIDDLNCKDEIRTILLDNKSRNLEAKAMKENKIVELNRLIDILNSGANEQMEITNARIRKISQKMHLSNVTVEKVFKDKHITIQKPVSLIKYNDVILSSVTMNKITTFISHLHSPDYAKQLQNADKVNNLYDFLALHSNDFGKDYSKKSLADLNAIIDNGVTSYAAKMDPFSHVMSDLFSIGKTQVFKDEDTRKKYDNALKLDKLNDFLELLKGAPEEFKKDEDFAENCISRIQTQFPDYEVARTIYNQKVGLLNDPYERETAGVDVYCGKCRTPHRFKSLKEAQLATCMVCHEPLFMPCPSCGKLIPTSMEICSCGFHVFEIQFLNTYIDACQAAIKSMDIEEAKKYLLKAKSASPKNNSAVIQLESELNVLIGKFKVPLEELSSLMMTKKYVSALKKLNEIKIKFPNLNLKNQEKEITNTLNRVRMMFDAKTSDSKQNANCCVDILDICQDFQPAIEYLQQVPPQKVPFMDAKWIDNGQKGFYVSWKPVLDSKGISYHIVRKEESIPLSLNDGKVVASNLSQLDYMDTSAKSGVSYYYGVIASRAGVHSPIASKEVVNLEDLNEKKMVVDVKEGYCYFSWQLPENCIGVRVLRNEHGPVAMQVSGNTKMVCADAKNDYKDVSVFEGNTYEYRLQAIYRIKNQYQYSSGLIKRLTPESQPEAVNFTKLSTTNGNLRIEWMPKENRSRQIKVVKLNDDIQVKEGQIFEYTDLSKMGIVLGTAMSSSKTYSIAVPPNQGFRIALMTISNTKMVSSKVLQASTYDKCEIDKKNTRVNDNRLVIFLDSPIPESLYKLHYTVATKQNQSKVPWATVEDAKNGTMNQLLFKQPFAGISIGNVPKEQLYITVIGEYKTKDGTTFIGEPSKFPLNNKPKVPIMYNVNVRKTGFGKNKKQFLQLIVSCNDNEVFPDVYFCIRQDGKVPLSYMNSSCHVIKKLSSKDFTNGNSGTFEIPMEDLSQFPSGAEIRMFVEEDVADAYIAEAYKIKNCKLLK